MIKQNHQWVSTPGREKLRAKLFSYWQERIFSCLLMSTESENRPSVWEKGDLKKSRGDGRERGRGYRQIFEAAVPRSCRSSVSKIVIYHKDTLEYNQLGSTSNKWLLPRAKLLLFPMSIFSWFNWANVIFAASFMLRGRDAHIDLLQLVVSGRRDFSLWCKDILVELF